jgi:hypothetical protein
MWCGQPSRHPQAIQSGRGPEGIAQQLLNPIKPNGDPIHPAADPNRTGGVAIHQCAGAVL